MNLLDAKDVLVILKCSKGTLVDLIDKHGFPQPIPFGKRKRRWREVDVHAWVAAQ